MNKHMQNEQPQATRKWPQYSLDEAIDLYQKFKGKKYTRDTHKKEEPGNA